MSRRGPLPNDSFALDVFVRGVVAREREEGPLADVKLDAEFEDFASRYPGPNGFSAGLVWKRLGLERQKVVSRPRPLPLGESIVTRDAAYCIDRLAKKDGHLEWLRDHPKTNSDWQAVFDESEYLRELIATSSKRDWWLTASLDQIRQLLAHGNRK